MEFIKYPTIGTDTDPKVSRNTCDTWIVTEKVHGSNIGIYLDLGNIGTGSWIKFAKRSGFLTDEDRAQFPVDTWLEANRTNLEKTAQNVVKYIGTPIPEGAYLVIFGEFYGGWFPANPTMWKG